VSDTRSSVLAWESRWSMPTGLVTFAAIAILIAAAVVVGAVSGSGDAELLNSAHEHKSAVNLSAVLEAIGFVLLLAPLYFLFRTVAARSDRVRRQLVGLVIVAPLFFSISAVLNAVATNEASDQFTAGQAKSTLSTQRAASECKTDLKEKGAKEFGEEFDAKGKTPAQDCSATKIADDEASNALSEADFRGPATGFSLAARLGLAVALFYSCLWGMRVGLLSRFWGSMGMALGVAALLLLVQFTLIFFIYFGLLLIDKLPGGRPPAWAAGEAIPWPTPGQKAAAEMEPEKPGQDPELEIGDTQGDGSEDPSSRRKRKQRES
jgi:hypothetical protein